MAGTFYILCTSRKDSFDNLKAFIVLSVRIMKTVHMHYAWITLCQAPYTKL